MDRVVSASRPRTERPGCRQTAPNAETAARELGLDCRVEKVSFQNAIAKYGVMMAPALVMDPKGATAGRVPSVDEIRAVLS